MTLILASGSAARRNMLANAGLSFDVVPAGIDERAAEQPLLEAGVSAGDVALALAMAKALAVKADPGDVVIGADQVLDLDGRIFSKPESMEAARRQLLDLSGRAHRLHSAAACARDGAVVWTCVDTARLTMRDLDPAFVGRYLAGVGDAALGTVGAYQVEGPGIRLFEAIEGDFFVVLGLPLLPLLCFLRRQGLAE